MACPTHSRCTRQAVLGSSDLTTRMTCPPGDLASSVAEKLPITGIVPRRILAGRMCLRMPQVMNTPVERQQELKSVIRRRATHITW